MSNPPTRHDARNSEDQPHKGPNLLLLYSLVALALVAAVAIAMMIVYPFYLRR